MQVICDLTADRAEKQRLRLIIWDMLYCKSGSLDTLKDRSRINPNALRKLLTASEMIKMEVCQDVRFLLLHLWQRVGDENLKKRKPT